MKVLQVTIIFASLLAIAFAANATWGSRTTNSILALSQNITVQRVNGQFQQSTVNFPANGQINNRNITWINVIDRFTNSSGATASLWSGGPGFTFGSVNLKSQNGQGINSTVEFYVNK